MGEWWLNVLHLVCSAFAAAKCGECCTNLCSSSVSGMYFCGNSASCLSIDLHMLVLHSKTPNNCYIYRSKDTIKRPTQQNKNKHNTEIGILFYVYFLLLDALERLFNCMRCQRIRTLKRSEILYLLSMQILWINLKFKIFVRFARS